MRRTILFKATLITGFMLFLFTECQDNFLEQKRVSKTREFTSLQKDKKLKELQANMDVLFTSKATSRAKHDLLENANWSRVYKIEDYSNDRVVYTIPMYVSKPLEFSNLILAEIDGKPQGLIITYTPTINWLMNRGRNSGLKDFTGTLVFSSLNGEDISSSEYLDGKRINVKESNNNSGRSKYCETWIDVQWTVVSVPDLGISSITEITIIEYEICYEPGGGGSSGSWGGFFGGEGGGGVSGGSSGGTSSGGDASISDQPEIGIIDLVDISYYLRPLKQGDDINNPYDGMQAMDSHGVIYTYNTELNAWLLPDLTFMLQNGHNIQFYNSNEPPNFNGAILATIWTGALVEPTPVGEVIAAGATIVVGAIFLYDLATYFYEKYQYREGEEICYRLYERCVQFNQGYAQCHNCLSICITARGEWPFDMCYW